MESPAPLLSLNPSPLQPAAYTPPEVWSQEWMEQHPDPEFRVTVENALRAGYDWPEGVRDALSGGDLGERAWPEGGGLTPSLSCIPRRTLPLPLPDVQRAGWREAAALHVYPPRHPHHHRLASGGPLGREGH